MRSIESIKLQPSLVPQEGTAKIIVVIHDDAAPSRGFLWIDTFRSGNRGAGPETGLASYPVVVDMKTSRQEVRLLVPTGGATIPADLYRVRASVYTATFGRLAQLREVVPDDVKESLFEWGPVGSEDLPLQGGLGGAAFAAAAAAAAGVAIGAVLVKKS